MLITAVGYSVATHSQQAANEIWAQVKEKLKSDLPCTCLFFSADAWEFSETVIAEFFQHRPDLELIGCGSFAEASSQLGGYAEHSCAAMFFCSDTIHMAAGVLRDIDHTNAKDLHGIARQALAPLHAARPPGKASIYLKITI